MLLCAPLHTRRPLLLVSPLELARLEHRRNKARHLVLRTPEEGRQVLTGIVLEQSGVCTPEVLQRGMLAPEGHVMLILHASRVAKPACTGLPRRVRGQVAVRLHAQEVGASAEASKGRQPAAGHGGAQVINQSIITKLLAPSNRN